MIKVSVEGNDYALKSEWDDITLEEYRGLCAHKIPASLKKRYERIVSGQYDKLEVESYRDLVKVHPKYYGEIIAMVSDIPKEVIDRMHWEIRTKLFNEYLLHFAETQVAPLPLVITEDGKVNFYEGYNAASFILNGEHFYFPESLEYGGIRTPLSKEKIVSFAEASDIEVAIHEFGEKGIDGMAQMCAVYLRKEREEHSDELVIKRTEQFKDLPMSVVWEVFFCIMRLGEQFMSDMQSYLDTLQQTEKSLQEALASSLLE